ncbi:MAG: glycosyltransferase family 39 protein [bacterium]
MNKIYKILIFVLASALVISLTHAFYFHLRPFTDSRAYDQIAMNLLAGQGYLQVADHNPQTDLGIITVGPGYQFFLAGVYVIFGHHWSVVWVIQALLHILSGWAIFLTARRLFSQSGEKIGLIAAILFLFQIDLIEGTGMLLTEPLFIFLSILTVYLAIKFFQSPNGKNMIFLGLVSGLAILTRPTILFLLPAIVLFLIFWRKISLSRRLVYIFLIIIIPTLMIAPWTYRNFQVYDSFILTTGAGSYNLWVGNHYGANGELEAATPEMIDYLINRGVVASSEKGQAEFLNFIKVYPGEYVKLLLVKASKYFSLVRPTGWWSHLRGTIFLPITLGWSALFSALLFIFGLSGWWLAWKQEKGYPIRLVQWFLVALPLPIILTIVSTRYRYPIYPLMALFAGYWLVNFWQNREQRKKYLVIFSLVALFLIINAGLDFYGNFDMVKDHLAGFKLFVK